MRCHAVPAGSGRQAVGGVGDRRRPRVERHRIGERVHDRVQALEELGEAAGEVDVAAADVVERQHSPEQPLSLLRHRHAHQHAIPARLPRVRRQSVEPVRRTLRRIEAPAHAAVARPLRDPRRGRRRRGGSAGGPARAPPGRAPARRSAGRRRGRAACATTPSTGFVWRSERSARRTCRSIRVALGRQPLRPRSSPSAAVPNVAWISGAKTSMSGHMTTMSRGSSVGSSASRCRIASRTTSTWRARPWQACTCRLRSSGSSSTRSSPAPGSGRPGGARSARMSAWIRPSSVGRCSSTTTWSWTTTTVGVAREDELHLASVLPPGGEQRILRQRRGRVLGAAHDRRQVARERGDPRPQLGRRVKEEEVHVPLDRKRMQDVEVARRQARQTEQRQRARGRSTRVRLGPQPRAGVLQPLGRTRLADARRAAASTTRPASRRRFPPPTRAASPADGRRSGRRDRRCAARCSTGVRRGTISAGTRAPPRCAASGASQGSPSDASTTSSSGQTDRAGSHGSASRSTPTAAATAPLTSRPGNGNSTFAHTPSARPGEAPSTADSRCVSQRSTPRVGTATTLRLHRVVQR